MTSTTPHRGNSSAGVSRRGFLTAAAATGAAAVLARPARAAAATRVPVSREERRVVVVGSGFAGGVAALRFAQAGVPVLVLERGKWWPAGPNKDTFATPLHPDKRLLWYGSAPELLGRRLSLSPYVGLLDSVAGDHMTALCAAGVGGGSLAYQGMSLVPAEGAFHEALPEALDYETMTRVYYPRVSRMLQLETAPDSLVNTENYRVSRLFAQHARTAGYHVEKVPMPIDWNYALAELRGEMKPSYTDSSGSIGINNGGKHTVDVTYIKQAQATGRVEVAAQHEVTEVYRTRSGKWEVHVNRISETGTTLQKKIITTPTLIMAAGSPNTNKLLVRAAALGHIPAIDGLGENWGTNGDRIYLWTDLNLTERMTAPQGGPVVYYSKEWDDPKLANTVIQASIPSLLGVVDLRSTVLVGYGHSPDRGRFTYDGGRDVARLRWPRGGDHTIHQRIGTRVHKVAGLGGLVVDTYPAYPNTWHALGGANMGVSCDLEGRVHDLPGLYVLDGALIPGSTAACNPSLTIAAVAERAMDRIVTEDVGSRI